MPVTPFHFGPGLLIKAAVPGYFSWCTFAAANVLIDIEPAIYWILKGEPAHLFFHTYLGSTLAGAVSALICLRLLPFWLRWWNAQLSPSQGRLLGMSANVSEVSIWCGAMIGAWSHVLLDSIMHHDIMPFAPLWVGNALLSLVSIDQLHTGCIGAGLIAIVWLGIRRLNQPWDKSRGQ